MSGKGESSKAVQSSHQDVGKCATPKKDGKGRRSIFKQRKPIKKPRKAPGAASIPVKSPVEDIPRELESKEFIRHAPSDSFQAYPPTPSPWKAEGDYVRKSLGPKVAQLPYESQSSDEL